MADVVVYQGDVGTEFIVSTYVDSLGSATTLRLLFEDPSGNAVTADASVKSVSDKTITWTSTSGFWTSSGQWKAQAYVAFGASQIFHGDPFTIEVREVIG